MSIPVRQDYFVLFHEGAQQLAASLKELRFDNVIFFTPCIDPIYQGKHIYLYTMHIPTLMLLQYYLAAYFHQI
jgi:hypothetical protein